MIRTLIMAERRAEQTVVICFVKTTARSRRGGGTR